MNYDEPVRDLFEKTSVAKLFHHLRDFGRKSLPLFSGRVYREQGQFIVAALISTTEIEREDFRFIMEEKRTLSQKIVAAKNDTLTVYENYSLSFDRLVVLMNLPWPKTHGEARLLDPEGCLRRNICKTNCDKIIDEDYLGRMKMQFMQKFGKCETILFAYFHIISLVPYTPICVHHLSTSSQNDITKKFLFRLNSYMIIQIINLHGEL